MFRRTSWILKRRYPPRASQDGKPVELEPENFVYDVVECTHDKKRPDIEAIFVQDIPGFAYRGEMRFVDREKFRRELVPQKLAVYSSQFNQNWYKVADNYRNGVFLRDGATSSVLDIMSFLKDLTLDLQVEVSPTTEEKVLVNSQFISLMLKLKHNLVVNSHAVKIKNELGGFSEPGIYEVDIVLNETHVLPLRVKLANKESK